MLLWTFFVQVLSEHLFPVLLGIRLGVGYVVILCSNYWGIEIGWVHFSSVTHLVIGRPGVWTQAVWLQNPCPELLIAYSRRHCTILRTWLFAGWFVSQLWPDIIIALHAWRSIILPKLSSIILRPFQNVPSSLLWCREEGRGVCPLWLEGCCSFLPLPLCPVLTSDTLFEDVGRNRRAKIQFTPVIVKVYHLLQCHINCLKI